MKRFSQILVSVLMSILPIAAAYNCPVYPRPQQCKLKDALTRVSEVKVYTRPNTAKALRKKLPADKCGAYALEITPGKLVVCAHDEVGVFYAKQTISQLLEGVPGARIAQRDPFPNDDLAAVARKGQLPCGTIIDWPDLPYRGTVEGYYGTPWSLQARLAQFDFYGRNKMNTYIYAPKDDPYHHGQGCYKPYPEQKANEIRSMVKQAHKNHLHFVWAIHPANTVNWEKNGGKDDMDALCGKLGQMYELGVRDFGVLVDDSGGEIGRAERQVQLCNYILEHFIRQHQDVNQTLIMCPTGYNRSWTNANFLNTLGNGLDKSIPVMWTGDTVVHDITLEGQKWVNDKVKRPTFIWWNWPCSDFKRGRLSMGRTYGLDTSPEMKTQMSGLVANPMEQAEASKVGLFGVADYTWNITQFHSDKTWKDGIRRLYPEVYKEMQVFCRHNSYLLPNGHGYFREESVDIAPTVQAFIESLNTKKINAEAAKSLGKEFSAMAKAGKVLLQHEEVADLRREIKPWFKQFMLTGQAGSATLAAVRAETPAKRCNDFFRALEHLSAMKSTARMDWNGGNPKPVEDVEVSMKEMTPALHAVFKYVNARVYAELAGVATAITQFSANAPEEEQKRNANVTDHNPATFWSTNRHQQVGDWICLDFGIRKDIRTISLLMGGPRSEDYAEEGVFETSNDGRNWKPLSKPMCGPSPMLDISRSPVRARMLRFRITKPRPRWLSVCMFHVNSRSGARIAAHLADNVSMTAFRHRDSLGINRVMELHKIRANEYIGLELPSPTHAEWLEIDLENKDIANWARLDLTLEGGASKQLPIMAKGNRVYLKNELPPERIESIRLTHTGREAQAFKLNRFCIGIREGEDEMDPSILTDSDLSTAYNCGKCALSTELTVPRGSKAIVVVGTATCSISGATPGEKGEYTQIFHLNGKTGKVTITADKQEGKYIHEIIFRTHKQTS